MALPLDKISRKAACKDLALCQLRTALIRLSIRLERSQACSPHQRGIPWNKRRERDFAVSWGTIDF